MPLQGGAVTMQTALLILFLRRNTLHIPSFWRTTLGMFLFLVFPHRMTWFVVHVHRPHRCSLHLLISANYKLTTSLVGIHSGNTLVDVNANKHLILICQMFVQMDGVARGVWTGSSGSRASQSSGSSPFLPVSQGPPTALHPYCAHTPSHLLYCGVAH